MDVEEIKKILKLPKDERFCNGEENAANVFLAVIDDEDLRSLVSYMRGNMSSKSLILVGLLLKAILYERNMAGYKELMIELQQTIYQVGVISGDKIDNEN